MGRREREIMEGRVLRLELLGIEGNFEGGREES